MLIHEIAKECKITKKAVQYYVEEGLLFPNILENGYKDFSSKDLDLLKKIVLYRKLGLSISDIKSVLNDQKEITRILHQRVLEIEREKVKQDILRRIQSSEDVEDLEIEIDAISSNSIIIKKLLDMFPSYYGKFLYFHFSRYLINEIETEEQMQAFSEIIDFFDTDLEIEFPEELKQYLDDISLEYSNNIEIDKINDILFAKDNAIMNIDTFLRDNKKIIEEYQRIRQTEEFRNTPAFQLMEYMRFLFINTGYYTVFIPAMRKLSPTYNEYYIQLQNANDRFIELYPEYGNN